MSRLLERVMPFFNLTKPAVGDLVAPVEVLNDNWDDIDTKLALINSGSNPVGTGIVSPVGTMEAVSSETTPPDIAVCKPSDSTFKSIVPPSDEIWGAWITINLAAGFNAVTGRTPQLKISNYDQVRFRGAIQYGTGTTAWPAGYSTVNSGQFLINDLTGRTICRNLSASRSGGNPWSMAQMITSDDGTYVLLKIAFTGATLASSNRVVLDGVSWYI
jgi:hypothetical protein